MSQNPLLKQYWTNRQHLTIIDDLLLFDSRLVIPRSLKLGIMHRLHEDHLGITKCRALACSSVWWLNISSDIEDTVKQKVLCVSFIDQNRKSHSCLHLFLIVHGHDSEWIFWSCSEKNLPAHSRLSFSLD